MVNCGPVIGVFGNDQANARSQHRGGVNVCFCDGSVRFVTNSTNQGIWFLLNSVMNGMPLNGGAVSND
jgi:prepilin-type processing-associated H-X9-DG protein